MVVGMEHHILTTPVWVVRVRLRPTPLALREVLEKEVHHMLELVIIEESSSPWRSPTGAGPKLDGSLRFCVHFCRLNEITLFDAYLCPV